MSTDGFRSHLPDVETWMLAVVALGLVAFVVAGVALSEWLVGLLISILLISLFGMSFNLLFGYTGILSFGHSMFWGTAAYMLVLILRGQLGFLPTTVQESFVLALVASVLITTALGAVIGVLCVQRGDIYFAMLTLAFSMMIYELAGAWRSLTGGSDGAIMPGSTVDLGVVAFDVNATVPYYYFVLALVVLSMLVIWRIVNSPYGQLLKAIRENPERAEFVGINVKFYQWTAFVLSAVFTAIGGALLAPRIFVVSPDLLHWSTSAEPIIVTLIGGPSSFLGPIVGSIVFIGLEELMEDFTNHWQVAVGAILIPIVLYTRGGIVGVFTNDEPIIPRIRESLRRTDYLPDPGLSETSRERREEDQP